MRAKKLYHLANVCDLKMGQSPNSSSYNQNRIGIPFFQGNADFGDIHPEIRYWCNKPIKIAKKSDILISVRAPIGAINIATEECCIGRGLAAITGKKNLGLNKYLYYALKSRVKDPISSGKGSTFKAINRKDLEDILIPVPSVKEQKQITSTLDLAQKLILLRKMQINALNSLVKSRFVGMFGDPVTNPMGWKTLLLEKLGELNRGVSKHRPRNAPELLGGKYPLIQTGEIAAADIYVKEYSATYSEIGFRQSKIWPKGTLCITIAANIAKTAILDFDACFPDSVVGFISGEYTNQLFIHFWFSFFQKMLEEQAPESAQKNINLQILCGLDVIVPPLLLQNRFAAFVRQADKTKFVLRQGLEKLELFYRMKGRIGGYGCLMV